MKRAPRVVLLSARKGITQSTLMLRRLNPSGVRLQMAANRQGRTKSDNSYVIRRWSRIAYGRH